ncbi:MAG: DUF1573 domain-containing protein [Bacteroidales bacterium]|nr:DUF1573 domain-containing protein [Bacteroidales bacterium]
MKKISFTLIFTFLLSSGIVLAQQKTAHISFEKKVHDYGTFKEESGLAKYKFVFTNTGNEPLIITKVQPSCGCTSSNYTKSPVPPGGKGFVSSEYSPKNRPGKFNKSIKVITNAEPAITMLRITGNVIQREKTIKDLYPFAMGAIRSKTSHIAFLKIKNTKTKTDSTQIINTSDEEQKLTFEKVPSYITIKAVPEVLKPKAKGYIITTYDASKNNNWGFVINRVNILINDQKSGSQRLSISATIEEDFSQLTEKELLNAPVIEFERKIYNFGTIKQGEIIEHDYKFTNTGKRDLIIRKTKASCGCTAISPANKIIKQGETSSIKVKFNSRGKKRTQNKTITIITNDPKTPSIMLKITGNVTVPSAAAPKK